MLRKVKPKSDVTTSKKYRFNNRLGMTLKVVITPLYLLYNVVFYVDNTFCVENMQILANIRLKI